MNNEILFKPNALILATANDTITASEFKLYETLLQRCQVTKDYGWRKAEIRREEIQELIKNRNRSTIEEIKSTLDKFQKIDIKFKLNKKDVSGVLIAEHIYDPIEDKFTCSMSENVFTALMDYNTIGYAPIDLKLTKRARGFYSQKLYGLFRMWSRPLEKVVKTYTLEQLKSVCDIFEGTAYDRYDNFKRKVINPAIKEINDKFNMKIEGYKEIKRNRRVYEIEFSFTDYEPRRYNFDDSQIVEAEQITITDIIEVDNNITSKSKDTRLDIDSIDYMHLIDLKINESVHSQFLNDYSDYKNYIAAVETASSKTLTALGSKTINKRNYKYFRTTLDNLIPSESLHIMFDVAE